MQIVPPHTMKNSVHGFPTTSAVAAGIALWMVLVPALSAQIAPFTVEVAKRVDYKEKTHSGSSSKALGSTRSTVQPRGPAYYSIKVANTGMQTYSNLKIDWVVLIQNVSTQKETLEQGEQTFSVEAGKSVEQEVHPKMHGDLLGCSVEVYQGQTLVLSKTEPPDAKEKITKLKAH